MIFYHVEQAKKKEITTFIPRIPSETLKDENITIPRICVSSSIEGCLNAVPWGGHYLDYFPECQIIRVYVFETDNYLTPEELVENKYVADALYNNEFWILDEIQPLDMFYISNISYTHKVIEFENGKTHTILENIKYDEIEDVFQDEIDLSEITHSFNQSDLEFICYFVINSYFDDDCYFIDDIQFKNNKLYIESEYVFNKQHFFNKLIESFSDEFILDFIA